jgi:hypothetical protein
MLTTLVLLRTIGTTDCRPIAESPDQSDLPFMCLQYGMEEAAKHPVPDGKFVRVACVPKSVPPDYRVVAACRAIGSLSVLAGFAVGVAIHNETLANP